MALTVQDLVNRALLALGEIQPGEAPNATESANALIRGNYVLDSWSLEGITAYTHAVASFALTANVGAYTMGLGGLWNVAARPVKIKGARISYQGLDRGVLVMPMAVFEQSLKHDEQPVQPVQYLADGSPLNAKLALWAAAALPLKLGEDSAAPLKNIRLWPVQTVAANIELSYWLPLTLFANLTDNVTFPVPGYEAALVNEWAIALAPDYGRPVTQELLANSQRFKQRIIDINGQIELGPPPAAPPQGQ